MNAGQPLLPSVSPWGHLYHVLCLHTFIIAHPPSCTHCAHLVVASPSASALLPARCRGLAWRESRLGDAPPISTSTQTLSFPVPYAVRRFPQLHRPVLQSGAGIRPLQDTMGALTWP